MNRIRRYEDIYQVLITPDVNNIDYYDTHNCYNAICDVNSPDSSFLLGSWLNPNIKNFIILEFTNMNDAMYESLKFPDINWDNIVRNHKYIFEELFLLINKILESYKFNVQFIPHLMSANELKEKIFDRVMDNGQRGNRFSLYQDFTDIINFTIVNPWFTTLDKISRILENNMCGYNKPKRKIINYGKIINLIGNTTFGTTYQIRLVPTLLYQYKVWDKLYFKDPILLNKLIQIQNKLDADEAIV